MRGTRLHQPGCYTEEHHLGGTVPTKHRRINVTKDAELAAAISRARPLMNGAGEATIVHDLAIRGAEALVLDEDRRRDAIEELIAWSLGDEIDRETLLNIDELAYRRPPTT
jgi:hypothetical protein